MFCVWFTKDMTPLYIPFVKFQEAGFLLQLLVDKYWQKDIFDVCQQGYSNLSLSAVQDDKSIHSIVYEYSLLPVLTAFNIIPSSFLYISQQYVQITTAMLSTRHGFSDVHVHLNRTRMSQILVILWLQMHLK